MDPIYLAYFSALSVLIPLALGAMYWKCLSKPFIVLFILLIVGGLTDIASFIFTINGINSWPIVNIYFIVQFTFLFGFIYLERKSGNWKFPFVLLLCLSVYNYFLIQTPFIFNSYTAYGGALVMIFYSLIYLYDLFRDLPVERIQDMPMLWVIFGFLFYYGGTLFLFLANNIVLESNLESHRAIWVLHNILNVMKNVFLSIALWKQYKRTTSHG